MALSDGMSVADVAALTNNNDGFGGNNGWWILLLLLIWNNGYGGFGYGNNFANGNSTAPYFIDTNNDIQRGFDQSAIIGSLNTIGSDVQNGFANVNANLCNGFANVQQSLCGGFAGVNQTVQNGFSQAEIANNARQMANMQQQFGISQQLNNMMANFDSCCCDAKAQNAANYADLKYTVATENCADRYEAANNTKDIINAINNGIQSIKDDLCSDRLANANREIDNLRTQLNMANLQASQTAQTAQLMADNAIQTQNVENYIRPQVNPCYVVPNPNCCSNATYSYCNN